METRTRANTTFLEIHPSNSRVPTPKRKLRRVRPRTPQRFPRPGLLTELGGFNVLDQFGTESPGPCCFPKGDHEGYRHVWNSEWGPRRSGPAGMGRKTTQDWDMKAQKSVTVPCRRGPRTGTFFQCHSLNSNLDAYHSIIALIITLIPQASFSREVWKVTCTAVRLEIPV